FVLRPFGWIYGWYKPRVITYEELNEFIEVKKTEFDLGSYALDDLNKIKKTLAGDLDISVEWDHEISIQVVAHSYYEFLNSKKAIDFNEILYRSYKIISENDFIVTSLANKFYEISIDE